MNLASAKSLIFENSEKSICYNTASFGIFPREMFENMEIAMTIYTRLGAPVRIVEAEKRRRWWVMKPGRSEIYDALPTARQKKCAQKINEFDIWWIKAQQTGAYPDGSGADQIGKFLNAPEDRTKRGFLDENFFRADLGIQEIHAECEIKLEDAKAA